MVELLQQAIVYATDHRAELLGALGVHLALVVIALLIGIVVCVPLGIWTARSRWAARTVITVINTMRVIPSLAILFLMLPYLGLTFEAALVALTVLALPPILLNTDVAFRTLDPAIREAARGLGMTPRQQLWRVEVPLALPLILAGIRTAAVEVIASATLAAFIGVASLGLYITRGFALYDQAVLLVGAVPVALLALMAEIGFGLAQRAAQSYTR